MACAQNFPLTELCTKRFGNPVKGSAGRGNYTPFYIVLHKLSVGMTDYDLEMQVDIPSSTVYQSTPKSVHYLVNGYGAIHQYVKTNDVAWGFNGIVNPSISIPSGITSSNIDNIAIHIAWTSDGMTTEGIRAVQELVCCLALEYNVPPDLVHIIPAYYIDDRYVNLQHLPLDFVESVSTCVTNGGVKPPTNEFVTVPGLVLLKLEECCKKNKEDILALSARLDDYDAWKPTVEARLVDLQGQIDTLNGSIGAISSAIPMINSAIAGLTTTISDIKACVRKICPEFCDDLSCDDIHYQLSGMQLITPHQPVRINFQNKISDSIPNSVITGSLWTAHLTCPCVRKVTVVARLALSNWCAGRKAWIDMIDCNGRTRISEFKSGGEMKPVNLPVGEAIIPASSLCDVYFELGTNDTSVKYIDFADVQMICQ